MVRIRWFILVVALGVSLWGLRAQAASLDLRLTTNPPVQAILPDETFATTTIEVRDENGDPLNGLVWVHLRTPPAPRLLGTDFPYVEDTLLLDIPAQARDGRIELGLVYPIRGTYTFDIEAPMPDGGVRTARATLTIQENPAEVRNFVMLLGVLFGVGLLAGAFIGWNAPRPLVLTGALLGAVVLSVAPVSAHGGDHETAPAQAAWTLETATLRLDGTFSATEAEVGTPLTLVLHATPLTDTPLPAGYLLVEAIHAEDEKPMYRLIMPVQPGEYPAAIHLFDGAPHHLRFTLVDEAAGETATYETVMPVRGLAPPLWVKMRALFILLTPVLAGLLLGYGLTQRTTARRLAGAHA